MIVSVTTLTAAFRACDFGQRPLFKTIANVIATEIHSGRLPVGAKLPPHRELAEQLGVTVGTVTRAFAQLLHDGLVVTGAGRGSFVAPREHRSRLDAIRSTTGINLNTNQPVIGPQTHALQQTLKLLAKESTGLNLRYAEDGGDLPYRTAGAQLLAIGGVHVPASQVVVTTGAQASLVAVLSALTRPGDTVCTERLGYPGLNEAVRRTGNRVVGVAMDEQGMVPASLRDVCRKHGPRLLVTVPTFHNPTGITSPLARRRALIEVARDHHLIIVEDDPYRFLGKQLPPPLAALAPERTCYIAGTSKCLLPALRVGFIAAPSEHFKPIAAAIHALGAGPSPLALEVLRRWLDTGTATALMKWQREELARRTALARRILGKERVPNAAAFHLWLPLPSPRDPHSVAAELANHGVGVTPSSAFAIGSARPPSAIRICLAGGPGIEELRFALGLLSDVLGTRGLRF